MSDSPVLDEWDGNIHKAQMCVACIVSGWIASAPTVTTSCGMFIDTTTQRDPSLPRCPTCTTAPDPETCGFCGDSVNKKWK